MLIGSIRLQLRGGPPAFLSRSTRNPVGAFDYNFAGVNPSDRPAQSG